MKSLIILMLITLPATTFSSGWTPPFLGEITWLKDRVGPTARLNDHSFVSLMDKSLKVYELPSFNIVREIPLPATNGGSWTNLFISPDAKTIALVGSGIAFYDFKVDQWTRWSMSNIPAVISWSTDGMSLFAGYNDGKIDCLNSSDGQKIWSVSGHAAIRALSANTGFLLSQDEFGEVQKWNVSNGNNEGILVAGDSNSIRKSSDSDIRFFANGAKALISGTSGVEIYDSQTNQISNILSRPEKSGKVAISQDEQRFVVTGGNGVIYYYDLGSLELLYDYRGTTNYGFGVKNAFFVGDNKTLFVVDALGFRGVSNEASLWDLSSANKERLRWTTSPAPNSPQHLWQVHFSPNNEFFTSGSNSTTNVNQLQFWNVSTGDLIANVNPPPNEAESVHSSPDGQYLTYRSSTIPELFSSVDKKTFRQITSTTGRVRQSTFIDSNQLLFAVQSQSGSYTFEIQDVASGRTLFTSQSSLSEIPADFVPLTGHTIAGWQGLDHRQIVCYDLFTLKERWRLPYSAYKASPDGNYLVTYGGSMAPLQVVDANSGQVVRTVGDPDYYIWKFTFFPDGKTLAIANYARNIDIVDFTSGKLLKRFLSREVPTDLAVSPDSKTLISVSGNGFISVWDL